MLNDHPHAGMPPLEDAPPLSFYEFLSPRLFYLPVWAWVAWLALRHGGLRLPLVANPSFPAGGLVGESKTAVLDLVGPAGRPWFAPHTHLVRGRGAVAGDVALALARAEAAGIGFPMVAKPDLGCRGAGVRPVADEAELAAYLEAFPGGARVVVQELVPHQAEAGVFWVRLPGEERGRIISLTLKYFPHVVGDGATSLEGLIRADPRAGQLAHLYLGRHRARLHEILPAGQAFRLAFAGSHSRGAIFRDGTAWVTEAMEARFGAIAASIPEFWFGRFDVRFETIEALRAGEGFRVVEVNGAGAEATHIWDSRMALTDAYRSLFRQWSLLWEVGARNRARGFRPEPAGDFWRRWRTEKRLIAIYPETA
jgi:hypothetical protein